MIGMSTTDFTQSLVLQCTEEKRKNVGLSGDLRCAQHRQLSTQRIRSCDPAATQARVVGKQCVARWKQRLCKKDH